MILLFSYRQEVETAAGQPGQLGPIHATYNTEQELDAAPPQDPGEYVAYQAKGRTSERNVPPRFEFLKYVTVSPPPELPVADVSTSKKF